MSNTDAIIVAARALITEHLQKRTLQRAFREGISMRRGVALSTIEVLCTPRSGLARKDAARRVR
jgi:hypothetical protein